METKISPRPHGVEFPLLLSEQNEKFTINMPHVLNGDTDMLKWIPYFQDTGYYPACSVLA